MKNSIIKEMQDQKTALEKSIRNRTRIISNLPDGRLNCYKNRDYYTWYNCENTNGKHARSLIPKNNRAFAEKLALRAYHNSALATEVKQLRAVKLFLNNYENTVPGVNYLLACPEHQRLLRNCVDNNKYSEDDVKWMKMERPLPQIHREDLIVPTCGDFCVRSKSEAEYVLALTSHHLVFRYEWPLELPSSGITVWPDFTIKRPGTDKLIFIEHFGMMDDVGYKQKNAVKLHNYMLNGIYPGYNLFISYESTSEKFTSLDANAMIESIFF